MIRSLALIALAAPALAGTTDDAIPDSRYLRYADGFRPYTRRIDVVEPSGALAVSTCVCIADRWALTAAHVVAETATASVEGNPVEIVFVHAGFDDDKVGWNDIALLRVRDDFHLDYYPPLSTGGETVGDVVSLAGFGITGRLSTGYVTSDGLLRAGTNRIVRFERSLLVCPAARGGSPLPFCIAPGDSGGPVFSGSGATAALCGIASFTMRDKGPLRSREGEEMGATRVSLFVPWIEECMEVGK